MQPNIYTAIMASVNYIYLGTYVIRLRDDGVPPIFSAAEETGCLCTGEWALRWVDVAPSLLDQKRESLGLAEAQFADLRDWCTAAFDDAMIGYPDVFFTPSAAMSFRDQFFKGRDDIEVISLFADSEVFGAGTTDEPPSGIGKTGHSVIVERLIGENAMPKGVVLGFDIVGVGFDGSLTSFHSERENFPDVLELNSCGLIADEAFAQSVANAGYARGGGIDDGGCFAVKVVGHSS